MAAKDELGRCGEQVAVDYLLAEGMRILDRNWRCRRGEIDVIAEEGGKLVIVEGKTRSGRTHRTALETGRPDQPARPRTPAATALATQPHHFASLRADVRGPH